MKKLLNIIIIASLLFVLGFGNVRASANEMPSDAFIQNEEPLINSEELKENLTNTVTAFGAVEAYAMNATIQTQVAFEKIEEISINLNLVQPLETHLDDVNKSAERWLDDIKPQMLLTTQDIVSFTNTYHVYSDAIKEAIEDGDKPDVLYGVKKLEEQIGKYDARIEILIDKLTSYRNELGTIVANLQNDFTKIEGHVEGEDGELAVLKNELDALEGELKKLDREINGLIAGTIVSGGVLVAGIIIAKLGGPLGLPLLIGGLIGVGVSAGLLAEKQEEKGEVLRKIADITKYEGQLKNEYGVLSHINNAVGITQEFASDAFSKTEELKTNWVTMQKKFASFRETVEEADWEGTPPRYLIPAIKNTDKEAQDINEYAKNLQLQYEVIIEEPEE